MDRLLAAIDQNDSPSETTGIDHASERIDMEAKASNAPQHATSVLPGIWR